MYSNYSDLSKRGKGTELEKNQHRLHTTLYDRNDLRVLTFSTVLCAMTKVPPLSGKGSTYELGFKTCQMANKRSMLLDSECQQIAFRHTFPRGHTHA